MEIKIGYIVAKPVETQAQCGTYTALVEAVDAHNAACAVGDTMWDIADNPDCYEVTDGGTMPDPADLPKPEPTLKEQLETLKAAQADTDAMTVDQEYRIALLELGITDETA